MQHTKQRATIIQDVFADIKAEYTASKQCTDWLWLMCWSIPCSKPSWHPDGLWQTAAAESLGQIRCPN
jgi:hypothetical protein